MKENNDNSMENSVKFLVKCLESSVAGTDFEKVFLNHLEAILSCENNKDAVIEKMLVFFENNCPEETKKLIYSEIYKILDAN